MTLSYVAKLGFTPQKTIIGTQKFDSSAFKTYKMVTAKFLVHNKLDKAWFFEETFLLANTGIEVILEMLFLYISNANLQFGGRKLT